MLLFKFIFELSIIIPSLFLSRSRYFLATFQLIYYFLYFKSQLSTLHEKRINKSSTLSRKAFLYLLHFPNVNVTEIKKMQNNILNNHFGYKIISTESIFTIQVYVRSLRFRQTLFLFFTPAVLFIVQFCSVCEQFVSETYKQVNSLSYGMMVGI